MGLAPMRRQKTESHAHGIKPLVDAAEVVVGRAKLGCMLLVVRAPDLFGQVAKIHVLAVFFNGHLHKFVD